MAGKGKTGPAPKLTADETTLNTVRGLGQIQATSKECAAVLGVSEPTWIKFKRDNPQVETALFEGQGKGLASLRRRQFRAAEDGNATMLVWLGKQYLGQADKQEIAQTVEVTHTDARTALESLIDRQVAAGTSQGGAGKPH